MDINRYKALGRELDGQAMALARERWDSIAKPLHGLGRLEGMVTKMAGIQGSPDVSIKRRAVLVFCADNGITAQGVTQTDSHVTALVADNIAQGKASVNKMCGKCGTDVFAVDMGIQDETHSSRLLFHKIARGTKDFSMEPAMSLGQAIEAVDTGIALVKEFHEKGYGLLATGEMGIGNTTTGSALAAALLGLSPKEAVGRGAGLSAEGLAKKREVVRAALGRYDLSGKPALEALCCVGGFDIGGMAGAFIGGCLYGVPVIIDGMISAVAALLASRLCPRSVGCMLASHSSREPCTGAVLKALGLTPVIDGELALGEGTGAALLIPMLDMALGVYQNDETFEKIKIDRYTDYEKGEEGKCCF